MQATCAEIRISLGIHWELIVNSLQPLCAYQTRCDVGRFDRLKISRKVSLGCRPTVM